MEPIGPTPPPKNMAEYLTPPTPGALPTADPNYRQQLEADEETIQEDSQSNTFTPANIDLRQVKANLLGPREQEAAGNEEESIYNN